MAKTTNQDIAALERAGIFTEIPKIIVEDEPKVIETVAESDLATLAREETFMNQPIKIRLATTTDENAPPFATVTVNHPGNRSQIPRGVACWVKRSHVEVLARMRETKYRQPTRNPMDPEPGNELIGRSAMVYPFEVLDDPHPLGRAWLERVMGEEV